MLPNESQLRELYPRAGDAHLYAFGANCGELFERFDIAATPTRLCFFLAQVGHESGGLTIMEENLNYSAERMCVVWPGRFPTVAAARPFARHPEKLANNVYSGRMGNGPPESGDGWTYRGRGYIQITGRDGYEKVGSFAGLDLVRQPEFAFDPQRALAVASAFWEWKKLNDLCDLGDFLKVTRRINGGTTGMTDRRAWLDKVRRVLSVDLQLPDALSTAEIIALQRALQDAGRREVGAADGVIGPRTIAAIQRFRQEKGLSEGLFDQALLTTLNLPA
jgi:putative chitinase